MPRPDNPTLSQFIVANMEAILAEWQSFAMTMEPAASTMSDLALRDHAKQILMAIAKDLESSQTDHAQREKSKGLAPALSARETAAATHGALRHLSGFDLNQLGAEYRALRASVVRLWTRSMADASHGAVLEDMIRFNEAVDQAVAESTARYAAAMALSRDTFMAILAHDLRSPLGAITTLGDLMERTAETDTQRKRATQITRSAKVMGGMIRDLLDYTRTNLGKGLTVAPAPCSISTVCREALEEVRAAHPARQLLMDGPDELVCVADKGRMQQALSNLLNNAVQHGDPASPITLTLGTLGDSVVIAVKNFGTPIPPDSLQVIFDPLVQLAASPRRNPSTTSTNLGLGLFIAREIAQGHHGTLLVESTARGGTVFTIALPQGGPPQDQPAG